MRISTSSTRVLFFLTCLSGLSWLTIAAQQEPYDIVLTGGHVMDPANDIDGLRDVAIRAGRVARVAANISTASAKRVVDVTGLYIVPGLVDIHSHHYGYSGALFPDHVALPAGATTVVDAGGPGWRNFEDYREKILRRAKTRVLTFINIVGLGMGGDENDVADMDPQATAKKLLEYPDLIVGIKNAHFSGEGFVSVERTVEAGRLTKRPVILDNNILSWTGRDTRTKLLEKMRPGDLHTHFYNDRHIELLDRRTNRIQPFMHEARKRGVLFDLGHGGGSFLWPVADRAMRQGFAPDIISTDIHASSIMTTQSDMANCMSKMLLLGMTLQDVVYRSTVAPARAISRFPDAAPSERGGKRTWRSWKSRRAPSPTTMRGRRSAWGAPHQQRADPARRRDRLRPRRASVRGLGRQRHVGVAAEPNGAAPSEPAAIPVTEPIRDLLLKNGHLIDPASGRNGRFDSPSSAAHRAHRGRPADASRADGRRRQRQPRHAGALDLTPTSTHRAPSAREIREPRRNVNPDHNALRHGVTTVVDGGSTGWKNFESFKQLVIDCSQARVLAFLNISGDGMLEGDTAVRLPALDVEKAADMARRHAGTRGHPRRAPCRRRRRRRGPYDSRSRVDGRGRARRVPGTGRPGYRQLLERLRPGDLLTHAYDVPLPLLAAARERGVSSTSAMAAASRSAAPPRPSVKPFCPT